jgi:hypothetical protein
MYIRIVAEAFGGYLDGWQDDHGLGTWLLAVGIHKSTNFTRLLASVRSDEY